MVLGDLRRMGWLYRLVRRGGGEMGKVGEFVTVFRPYVSRAVIGDPLTSAS